MKILLVGEYSRLHNSLKEGLLKNGLEVTLIGHGDVFKKYPVDINTDGRFVKNNFLINLVRLLIYRIIRIDLASVETFLRFKRNKGMFMNYDVVQLINETPFGIDPYFEKKILEFIFRHNNNVFLSACGDDYIFISYLLSDKLPYSTITPLLKDSSLKKIYTFTLNYVTKKHKKLHNYIFSNIKAVIPASVEYSLAYQQVSLATQLIPNAINSDKVRYSPLTLDKKIKVFHGINTSNYIKKGHQYFKEALKIIEQKYPDKIEVITTQDLPYSEYIKKINNAHIILDQAHAHDQGYNALEAMAMGKVVFTGAGEAFKNYYQLKDIVAINTIPDSKKIANDLEQLILNPQEIIEIGKRARDFIEKEHHYITIAQQYQRTWERYSD